jgi:hypothetical protein
MKVLFAAAMLALTVPVAHSKIITIEPDDFIGKGPITSSYAFVQSIDEGFYSPVYAYVPGAGSYGAATGKALFGANNVATEGPHDDIPWNGFSIHFLVPVTEFELAVMNRAYAPLLGLDCLLYRAPFQSGSCNVSGGYRGGGSAEIGVPTFLTIRSTTPIFQVVLGGEDTIGAMSFDRVRFEVPEPSTLATLSFGLLGMFGLSRRRRKNT